MLNRASNWQTTLRRQYRRRDPSANPIGPEPRVEDHDERTSSPVPPDFNPPHDPQNTKNEREEGDNLGTTEIWHDEKEAQEVDSTRASTLEPGFGFSNKGVSMQPSDAESEYLKAGQSHVDRNSETFADGQESKDWLELPMLTKLDSLHSLMEWQFQNPMRLRTLMRNDDEDASWVRLPRSMNKAEKFDSHLLASADRTYWV